MPYLQKATHENRRRREGDDLKRKKRMKIYTSRKWRAMSEWYIKCHPFCEKCLQKGLYVPAVDVHHKDSFTKYDGLEMIAKTYDPNNLMALCKRCHTEIHLHQRRK